MTLYRASVSIFSVLVCFCMPFFLFTYSLAIFLVICCKTKVLITSCATQNSNSNKSVKQLTRMWIDWTFWYCSMEASGSRNISNNKVRYVITCNRIYEIYEKIKWNKLYAFFVHTPTENSTRTIEIVFFKLDVYHYKLKHVCNTL